MEHNAFPCQCEDAFHRGQGCPHSAISLLATVGGPIALCACCTHHKHMTTKRTTAPEAEREACAAR